MCVCVRVCVVFFTKKKHTPMDFFVCPDDDDDLIMVVYDEKNMNWKWNRKKIFMSLVSYIYESFFFRIFALENVCHFEFSMSFSLSLENNDWSHKHMEQNFFCRFSFHPNLNGCLFNKKKQQRNLFFLQAKTKTKILKIHSDHIVDN